MPIPARHCAALVLDRGDARTAELLRCLQGWPHQIDIPRNGRCAHPPIVPDHVACRRVFASARRSTCACPRSAPDELQARQRSDPEEGRGRLLSRRFPGERSPAAQPQGLTGVIGGSDGLTLPYWETDYCPPRDVRPPQRPRRVSRGDQPQVSQRRRRYDRGQLVSHCDARPSFGVWVN
jgi:hypothetical protein